MSREIEKDFLTRYDMTKYERPSLTADMTIFSVFEKKKNDYRKLAEKKLKILLVKRGNMPFQGMYALPGGFVRKKETVEEAAMRELYEETGIECTFLEQLRVFSESKRDPRGWIITCSFVALINGGEYCVKSGDDADEAEWFDISFFEQKEEEGSRFWKLYLENDVISIDYLLKEKEYNNKFKYEHDLEIVQGENLAFDHALIIAYALIKLRKIVRETDVAFRLAPMQFTLTEMQKIYETILGEKILAPVFRRGIVSKVEEVGELEENAGHRPAKLYKYKS